MWCKSEGYNKRKHSKHNWKPRPEHTGYPRNKQALIKAGWRVNREEQRAAQLITVNGTKRGESCDEYWQKMQETPTAEEDIISTLLNCFRLVISKMLNT